MKKLDRTFVLACPGSRRGISCHANGAYIGGVPLLNRLQESGQEHWQPRDCGELSKEIGAEFGIPVDMSSKMGGLKTIARALTEGDVARAQIATVLLGIPNPPSHSRSGHPRAAMIKLVQDLYYSDLIKADWDSDQHPRWPAGAPDGQGGQFAPKGGDNGIISARDVSGGRPRRYSEQECERQYASDMYVCGSLRDKRERRVCKESAAQRYAACLRGKPMPPLTLPDSDYDYETLPSRPPRRYPQPNPPWWLFIPWVLPALVGVPA